MQCLWDLEGINRGDRLLELRGVRPGIEFDDVFNAKDIDIWWSTNTGNVSINASLLLKPF